MTGSKYLTADGVVGPSGQPVLIFSITPLSGATAGKTVLKNGSTSSGTIYVNELSPTVSQSHTVSWEGGLLFPDGCFFDKDTNVASVVISYKAAY